MCTKPAKDPASENPSMDGEGLMESHAWMRNDWQVMSTRERQQACFGDEKLSRSPEDGPVRTHMLAALDVLSRWKTEST